ncbi:hypothetical protein BDZ45DRAFT_677184, partial [Acephala macrosclerotiorum]
MHFAKFLILAIAAPFSVVTALPAKHEDTSSPTIDARELELPKLSWFNEWSKSDWYSSPSPSPLNPSLKPHSALQLEPTETKAQSITSNVPSCAVATPSVQTPVRLDMKNGCIRTSLVSSFEPISKV